MKIIRWFENQRLKHRFKWFLKSNLEKHIYVTWKSGSGKSEFLKSFFYLLQERSAKKKNLSLIFIDPHGDVAREIKNFYSNKNNERVVYIDPFLDSEYTPVINPFQIESTDEHKIDITTQYLVAVFKELLPSAQFSHNMEALLYPCISILLKKWDASLWDLQRFMNDEINTDLVQLWMQSNNKQEAQFFATEFFNPIYRVTKASLLTKLQSILNKPSFYRLVTWKNTLSIQKEMQKWSVLIFNLAKGHLGIETSQIFGRFIVAIIQSVAQNRIKQPKKFRKKCFLFIDEAQNYISSSIDIILKEARKFGVFLVLANQNVTDIEPSKLLYSLLNNTDIKVIGRNGNKSLSILAREVGVKTEKLENLKKFEFLHKNGDGTPLRFKGTMTLNKPFLKLTKDEKAQFKKDTLKRFYKKIEIIKTYIKQWVEKPKFELE